MRQYPPTVSFLPDGKPNPLYDPSHTKPEPPPPPPLKKVQAVCVTVRVARESHRENVP